MKRGDAYREELVMKNGLHTFITVLCLAAISSSAHAWDHPGHMTTANIAYSEIEAARPDLIEKLGLLFMAHPGAAPFWVAAGAAKGKEGIQRKFVECARWADDVKFSTDDRPTWHTARWAIVAKDAPENVRKAAAAREGKPAGQALEALKLAFRTLSNPESNPKERALALCWALHIIGDIHQPMHVSDLFSKDFPSGNVAATTSYVEDPITKKPMPLHVLWDTNALRVPSFAAVESYTKHLLKKHPRSSFSELKAHPVGDPNAFEEWAKESHQVAMDWAYDLQTLPDPNKDQDADELMKNMVNFILTGESHVKQAPKLPAGYWEKLQLTAERRIALAGYRIADLILSAANQLEAERRFIGR